VRDALVAHGFGVQQYAFHMSALQGAFGLVCFAAATRVILDAASDTSVAVNIVDGQATATMHTEGHQFSDPAPNGGCNFRHNIQSADGSGGVDVQILGEAESCGYFVTFYSRGHRYLAPRYRHRPITHLQACEDVACARREVLGATVVLGHSDNGRPEATPATPATRTTSLAT
jgi:hypothetical protein